MQLILLALAISSSWPCILKGDNPGIYTAIQEVVNDVSKSSDNLYILNDFTSSQGYSDSTILRHMRPKDMVLGKQILRFGQKKAFAMDSIRKYLRNTKFLSYSEFKELRQESIVYEDDEKEIGEAVDTQLKIWATMDRKDTSGYNSVSRKLDSLIQTPMYKKYEERSRRTQNWILCIHPYVTYKNYVIVNMNLYYPRKDSYLYVKLIRLNFSP